MRSFLLGMVAGVIGVVVWAKLHPINQQQYTVLTYPPMDVLPELLCPSGSDTD